MCASERNREFPQALWTPVAVDEASVAALVVECGLLPVVARILVARGHDSPEAVRRFLDPTLDRDWLPATAIPGMPDAAARVARAVVGGESILVFGDFDVDGVSSAALVYRGLAAMGARVTATVPDRFVEGYGLTVRSVDRVTAMNPALVLTVDCGISAGREVDLLGAAGIDVVVTDHHEPGESLPRGIPVANPKLVPDHPSATLSGAGVALKLVQAVGESLGHVDVWRELTDLAALGTLADVVPLTGENRALVVSGLARMRSDPRPGIAALAALAACSPPSLDADDIMFQIAPRLNAAGRMGDPHVSLELLSTDDPAKAAELARELDEMNNARKTIERDVAEEAIARVEEERGPRDRVIVVAGKGWHDGVRGIVASRLVRRYGVPAFVFGIEGDEARGSGRSCGTIDLFDAVSACSGLFDRYGGHSAAVGMSLPASRVEELRALLASRFATCADDEFTLPERPDALIGLADVGLELAEALSALAPFGAGNPRPRFVATGVFMSARSRVGHSAEHLRFTAHNGAESVHAIAFRCGDIDKLMSCDTAVDILFEVEANEWRGRSTAQMLVQRIAPHAPAGDAPALGLVEDLFARADEILSREDYSGIEEAESFYTKLVGVTFDGRQDVLAQVATGTFLQIVRQPDNAHDRNAIALHEPGGKQLGYFNRRLSAAIAPAIDAGAVYDVEVTGVTGLDGRHRGVNVLVVRRDAKRSDSCGVDRIALRAKMAALTELERDAAITHALIGECAPHQTQSAALEALADGKRCLVVMATGRGKSFIFHAHAARIASSGRGASVFIFPLRALVADQAYYLERVMASLGIRVATLTGESSLSERDEGFASLRSGDLDVALTTPEFFTHHAARFAESNRVEFVVVDEAHHVALAGVSRRPAYLDLGKAIDALGQPAVLAVTATSGDEETAAIEGVLKIERVITDPAVRENLAMVDKRSLPDKDSYLAAIASTGEKMIVYVNSRHQSVRLARTLRKRSPMTAARTVFYNAGLTRSVRHAVECAFRADEVSCVVATSAFGEGVNIPDIRHVALYHLPFSGIEFNQMCGRAGRDGAPAWLHAVFGPNDARVNEAILTSAVPSRDDLAALYAVIKDAASEGLGGVEVANAELSDRVRALRRGSTMSDRGVSAGIGIFRELGLVESEGRGPYRRLMLAREPARVELASSVRYTEGIEEIAGFHAFKAWALEASARELLERVNRPILPSRVEAVRGF